ncbi:MAG: transposase [Holophagaceae bacterium]|nr:transposase [Holophagaceae bacterium]
MKAELTHSLRYAKGEVGEKPTLNRRNGHTRKTLRTDHGTMEIFVPCDRLSDLSASFALLKYTRQSRWPYKKVNCLHALFSGWYSHLRSYGTQEHFQKVDYAL